MTLDADEFIRRFLMHVLPKGFRRIRHFGFLANACRTEKIARLRVALACPQPEQAAEPEDYRERCAQLTGKRIDICPVCGGRMLDADAWPHRSPPGRELHDVTPHDPEPANPLPRRTSTDTRPSAPAQGPTRVLLLDDQCVVR